VSALISYPLDEGGHVVIEGDDDVKGAVTRGLHPGEIIQTVGAKFQTAIEAVRPAALAVARNFPGFVDMADDVEVEFGVKFSRQAGAFIASAGTEAQFRIKMVWDSKPAM